MAKSNSNSNIAELTLITRKNSHSNKTNNQLSTKQSSKIKIAHRTRSKCPISEKSIGEIESQLPDDLLFDNQNTNDVSKMIENNSLSLSNINESLFTSASTPISINDPNDDLWFEFLNSLQQSKHHEDDSSLNTKENSSPSKLNDNDDASEDPDFTVCLESCDLEEPDYLDDWFQVPRKEAIALVKDAIEFCDKVPIVYDDQRVKDKSSNKTNKNDKVNENNTVNINTTINNITNDNQINKPAEIVQKCNIITEFIPQFTELQRKQLDEQLRNHVQLLTQTCVACYNSTEYSHLSIEARNLLNVLDSLNKEPVDSNEENNSDTPKTSQNTAILAPGFEIINLKDSFKVLDDLKNLDLPPWDLQNGLPTKVLETMINSRVFYNTNFLPTNKYKYSSQFTRASFTDCEKILLIMGFNQFKHLPKDECCQCIKDFLLPQRNCHDIKKQLSSISNSENRQASFKELIRKQKSINLASVENYDFKKEIHYKSPLEQADRIQLPSMYTLPIERLKMANILKETRNYSNQNAKASNENESKTVKPKKRINKSKVLTEEFVEILPSIDRNESVQTDSNTDCTIINEDNETNNQSILNQSNSENDISIISNAQAFKRVRLDKSPDKIITNKTPIQKVRKTIAETNIPNKSLESQIPKESIIQALSSNTFLDMFLNKQPQQTIIIDNNGRIISTNLSSLFSSTPTLPFTLPPVSHMQQQPQSNLVLPNNFNGTVLYHPTIHIHAGGKNIVDMSKYKKLAPKKN